MPFELNYIGRTDLPETLMPEQVISDIIKEAPKSSVVMANARRATLSAKKAKQPLLASLPNAYWVDGDNGLKQTTKVDWTEQYITAEELAVIVPIPDAVVDDANIPLWETVRPLITEAFAVAIDNAALFSVSKPDTWPEGIIPSAIAAGNTIQDGVETDIGVAVAKLGQKLARQGFGVKSFISEPGLQWELVGLRDANHNPIYTPLAGGTASGLYGRALNEVDNGAWDYEQARLCAVDWNSVVFGTRQDLTFQVFSEGVLSDENGKVVLNLMQQDTKALRVVMRCGFQYLIPRVTRLGQFEHRFPGAVITPAAAEPDPEP